MRFRRLWAPRALALSLALAFSPQAFAYVVYVDCDLADLTAEPVEVAKPIGAPKPYHAVGHHRRPRHRLSHRHVVYKCRITHRCRELGWLGPGAVAYVEDGAAVGFTTAYWDGAGAVDPPAIPEPTVWTLLTFGFGMVGMRKTGIRASFLRPALRLLKSL